VEPQLIKDYIQTGKATLEYRDFAWQTESEDAAAASDCALDQGKFWQYHDTLFLNQHGEDQGAFSRDRLKQMAKDIGLDTDKFNQCLDSGAHAKDVSDSSQQAIQAGFKGTPGFTVNGQTVNGYDYGSIKSAVDAALAKQ
jgi:protein-disulfide isomerase